MTKPEMIRALKAMQTQTIVQREFLVAQQATVPSWMMGNEPAEISDAHVTAQNHIDALQHIIDELEKCPVASRRGED